jgi:hypothetical protein
LQHTLKLLLFFAMDSILSEIEGGGFGVPIGGEWMSVTLALRRLEDNCTKSAGLSLNCVGDVLLEYEAMW